MPEGNFPNTSFFSGGHITVLLSLATLDTTSALWLGAILNGEVTNKKDKKNEENLQLNRLQKGYLFIVGHRKQEGSATLFSLSWDRVCGVTPVFHCSVHVCERP